MTQRTASSLPTWSCSAPASNCKARALSKSCCRLATVRSGLAERELQIADLTGEQVRHCVPTIDREAPGVPA